MTNTEKLIHESIEKISSETLRNTCNSVIKKETEYNMKYFNTDFELIINLQDSEYESSCDST